MMMPVLALPRLLQSVSVVTERSCSTPECARRAWFSWWAPKQSVPTLFQPESPRPLLRWRFDDPLLRSTAIAFATRCHSGAVLPLVEPQADLAQGLFEEATNVLRTWRADVATAFEVLVHTLLLAGAPSGSYGGASLADPPGVVWVRPDPAWRPEDLAECLLHETVHQAVFLHDLAHGLLTDHAFDESRRVPSAVRSVYPSGQEPLRAFWAAYHAALVAAALIPFLSAVRKHERSAQFRRALSASLPSLLDSDMVTLAGLSLLREAVEPALSP